MLSGVRSGPKSGLRTYAGTNASHSPGLPLNSSWSPASSCLPHTNEGERDRTTGPCIDAYAACRLAALSAFLSLLLLVYSFVEIPARLRRSLSTLRPLRPILRLRKARQSSQVLRPLVVCRVSASSCQLNIGAVHPGFSSAVPLGPTIVSGAFSPRIFLLRRGIVDSDPRLALTHRCPAPPSLATSRRSGGH
ncbi:hypothetical protein VTH06DRAFT_3790 [Thermothelomyces fergusii]